MRDSWEENVPNAKPFTPEGRERLLKSYSDLKTPVQPGVVIDIINRYEATVGTGGNSKALEEKLDKALGEVLRLKAENKRVVDALEKAQKPKKSKGS
jgi:hypothetical protein